MSDTPRIIDHLRDPLADPAADRSRLRFAAMLVGVGLTHFVAPRFFERIVPRWFPRPRAAVLWSGVAEVTSGALIALPRTRRLGAWLALATIVAVYPANVQVAIDAVRSGSRPQILGAWLRLPMQIPMLLARASTHPVTR